MVDIQSVVHPYKGIFLSNKNGLTTEAHTYMDVSQQHYDK